MKTDLKAYLRIKLRPYRVKDEYIFHIWPGIINLLWTIAKFDWTKKIETLQSKHLGELPVWWIFLGFFIYLLLSK